MCATTSRFLPRSACSSASCSATPVARAPSRFCTASASARTSLDVALPTISRFAGISRPDSAPSSTGSRLLASSGSSPFTLAASPFCADTANTCSGGTPSSSALDRACRAISASISAALFSSSQRPSILFRMTIRPRRVAASSPARCRRHTSRSVFVTPASAARMNSTACACGSSDSVSSGSVPIAFSPGVSRMTSPCFSSGCGKLMIACRQHGISTSAAGPSAESPSSPSGNP